MGMASEVFGMYTMTRPHGGKWSTTQGLLGEKAIVSDTEQLCFHFTDGVFLIRSDHFSAYVGRCTPDITMGRIKMNLANEIMAISLFPLDGLPLQDSRHMLLTAVGNCGSREMVWKDRILLDEGHGPVWIDQAEGDLLLLGTEPLGAELPLVYALAPDGTHLMRLPTHAAQEGAKVFLGRQESAICYEIMT